MSGEKIKIVGWRRQRETETEKDYDVLLKTLQALRGNRGICPKGVYRFRTFEEADRWMIRMIAKASAETQP
ncbi:MAG: hypothetical protein EPO39_19705 [Candidatus Manganitrophaceae bacterium]|nr:MAG: hypothetical protein EPO39_19705 [Candidatus Manganitrophaceae bacterium]